MTGLKIVLPTSFTDTSLPVLYDDQILSSGSLMLLDPIHTANPWPSGVPANLASLPNIAKNSAKTLTGQSTDSAVQAIARVPATLTSSVGFMERTSKGGLHGAFSNTAGHGVQYSGVVLDMPTAILKYILDNPRHSYYYSVWDRLTRSAPSGWNGFIASLGGSGQQTNCSHFEVAPVAGGSGSAAWNKRPSTTTNPPYLGSRLPTSSAAGAAVLATIGVDDWYNNSGTYPGFLPGDGVNTAVSGSLASGGIYFGSSAQQTGIGVTGSTGTCSGNAGNSPTYNDLHPSHIFYRFYIEDLTVSGRSYATVDALDLALFTAAFAAGGRYYNDTFTSPSTIS